MAGFKIVQWTIISKIEDIKLTLERLFFCKIKGHEGGVDSAANLATSSNLTHLKVGNIREKLTYDHPEQI